MIQTHEQYEMLTALATAGQLSDSELNDLAHHMSDCISCRERMAEMEEMSREIFLTHARSTSRSALPAGMQQRFQERARNAGVPLSIPVATPLGSGFLRLAFVTLLLTISAAVSWKLVDMPNVSERVALEPGNSALKVANMQEDRELPITKERLHSTSPQIRGTRQRKAIAQRELATKRLPDSGNEISQASLVLPKPSFLKHDFARTFSDNYPTVSATLNQDYMTLGLHPPRRTAFELASVPNIWGEVDRERFDQPTFHYNPDLVSLSFLDEAQGSGVPAIPTLGISHSQFHLDVHQTR